MQYPHPDDDILSARDINAHLVTLRDALADGLDVEDDIAAYEALSDAASDGLGAERWADGATIIKSSYFEEYAQTYAESIGAIEDCGRWPATYIDWEQAADSLKQDFIEVEAETPYGTWTYFGDL